MGSDGIKTNKKRKVLFTFLFAIGFFFVSLFGYGVYWAFFDMNRLPKGEFLTEETSPSGTYTVKAYVSRPALSDDAVRAELIFHDQNGKTKNIYWNFPESTATLEWITDDTVVINGEQLHVLKDVFDRRRKITR